MKKLLSIIIVSSLLLAGCADEEIQNENTTDLAAKCKPFMDQAAEIVNKACNDKLASQATLQSDFDLKQKCKQYENEAWERTPRITLLSATVMVRLKYSKKLNTCISVYNGISTINQKYAYMYIDEITDEVIATKGGEGPSDEWAEYEKSLELL